MKPKISPEDYRNIIESLDLDTLYVIELNSKFSETEVASGLNLNIDDSYSFEQTDSVLKVYYTFKLSAKNESKENDAISIKAKYVVRYTLSKQVEITKDFMKIFTEISIGMLLWTYFRELVNNNIYRMGMPQLVLPLKKR